MSTYLGNPSLSAAVKDRVGSTFQQAVALYKQGRLEEVIAGCGLILQMDPQFDPAKRLLEKARNPMLPIDVDALVPATAGEALTEAREAMRARDFQRVINITTEILTNDLMNDEARVLGDEARERLEAGPFVDQFHRKFDQSMANGDVASARGALDKARSLDPTHPAVARMESQITAAAPASPSFVVDAPPPAATGRGAAQATDFGFTFEEEKAPPPMAGFSFDAPAPAAQGGGFSFDAPPAQSGGGGGFSFDSGAPSFSFDSAAPAAAPAAGFSFESPAPAPAGGGSGDFDFSSATFETSPEDRKKIEQYLSEGDRAFSSGDYQQAIDIWSRIFLIDVTNDQASERIERAKSKRRESEDRVDTLVLTATQSFDMGDYDLARQQFNDVLRIDPANSTAHDYLVKIDQVAASAAPAFGGFAAEPAPSFGGGAGAPAKDFDIFAEDEVSSSYASPIIPPPAGAAAAAAPEPKKSAPAASSKKSPTKAIAAVVGALVLAGLGWFGYSKFFGAPAYDPTATQAIFKQANQLAKTGKYDEAIALLQDVKPEDPQHDKAVLLIADIQKKKSQASETIDGKPAAVFYEEKIAAGRAAYESHDFDGAKQAFEQATRVKPLPADVKSLYDTAAEQVAKLDSAKSLFRERRYADALANLNALLQQNPQNKNIQRMMLDAHFNLGATALQEERLPDAIREFDEVLRVDPNDELAKRSRDLAARYNGQGKDLLYKIYVKYLPLRQAA